MVEKRTKVAASGGGVESVLVGEAETAGSFNALFAVREERCAALDDVGAVDVVSLFGDIAL